MNDLLRTLIDSARQQAAATEAENAKPPETAGEKAKQRVAVARAKSQRDWADFAEKGMRA